MWDICGDSTGCSLYFQGTNYCMAPHILGVQSWNSKLEDAPFKAQRSLVKNVSVKGQPSI